MLLALHANNWLYGRIFTTAGYFYKYFTTAIFYNSSIFLQNINISDRIRQPNIVDSFRSFELACQCMEMLNKRWYHIFPPALPLVCAACCPSIRFSSAASPYKLYSRPPCIVLNSCFWFRPGIGQSLGIEPVTDELPDRAARVLSACQELEKVTCNKLYLRRVCYPGKHGRQCLPR